jgi:3-hydroxyacyl-CoA dehydrogenase
MEDAGRKPAQWVYDMLGSGAKAFYKVEAGKRKYYDITSKSYKIIPGSESLILLDALRETNVLYTNDEASVFDIGDGVLNVEFHSKMNVIGAGTLQALNKAIDLAEEKYKAVIVSNEADHFSAGANVGMIFMMASEQDWDELNFAVQMFQNTMMRLRYSAIPVIACPHGMTLGGGCELSMHSDKVIANAETYMGLVEFGVGLIPGGGGTKEFVLRLGDELKEGDIRSNAYLNRFLTIGQAKVSTSAYEAFDLGYLRPGIDEVIVSQVDQLVYAKKVALQMVEKGYSQPAPRTDVKVLGKEVHGLFLVGADSFTKAGYMSDHDKLIAEKLGYVMSGGDISQAMTEVSEKYLLELERKAFIELCMTRKTMERMQSLVSGGKILRN